MYQLIWDGELLHRQLSGEISAAELLRSLQVAHADPRYDDIRKVLNDFTACTSLSVPVDVIQEMAALAGAAEVSNRRIRFAFVATEASAVRVIRHYLQEIREFSSYAGEYFSTCEAARHWLDQPRH